jgi:hypothetical protein
MNTKLILLVSENKLIGASGPVYEPIPAHPDAIYRSQNRPVPEIMPLIPSDVIAPRAMSNNVVVAAPLAAGGSGFSPWWIIGPLLALLAAMAAGALAYTMKKKNDAKTQAERENTKGDSTTRKLPVENVPLRSMKSHTISSVAKGKY